MLVAVQLSVPGLYLPPCSNSWCRHIRPRRSSHCRSKPPCDECRASGALVVLVAVQLSVLGLYLPPVFKALAPSVRPRRSSRCRSKLPCESIAQRAHWSCWSASSVSVLGLYRPPVFKSLVPLVPPQTIISLPVQTAVWKSRAAGAWWCWSLSNYRCWDCIARQCSKRCCHQRFRPRRSSHCQSKLPCAELAQPAHWWCWWLSRCIGARINLRKSVGSGAWRCNTKFVAGSLGS